MTTCKHSGKGQIICSIGKSRINLSRILIHLSYASLMLFIMFGLPIARNQLSQKVSPTSTIALNS